jgi:hypothetical protein
VRERDTVAWFNCSVDGWRINSCRIVRDADGFLKVHGPATHKRNGGWHSAVVAPAEVWIAIAEAALREYSFAKPVDDERAELREEVLRMVG